MSSVFYKRKIDLVLLGGNGKMVLKWKLVLPLFNEKIELYAASLLCVNASYMGVYVHVSIQGSFENEALENEDRSTKHPNLENEAPKT